MKPMLNNPRRMSKKAAGKLYADLAEFGDLGGIVHNLTDDTLCGGHQRLRVLFGEQAGAFKVTDADIEIVRELPEPDAQGTVAHGFILWRGFRYAYRRVAWIAAKMAAANIKANLDGGQWDWDALSGWDAEALEAWGFDADALAVWNDDAANLREMLTAEAETTPEDAGAQVDRAEELQAVWQVQTGDVWEAGEHFVICGDCRETETWARLLAAAGIEKVSGVFTSPPYAMQRKEQYGGVQTGEYVEWWDAVQSNVRANLAGDGSFFVNIKPHCEDGQRVLYVFDLVLAMVRRWGWRFVDELCWKHNGYPGKWDDRLKNMFEPVYHFSVSSVSIRHKSIIKDFEESSHSNDLTTYDGLDNAPAYTKSPFRQRNKKSAVFDGALPGNVLNIAHSETATQTGAYQAAAFPVALPAFFIKAYSDPGDVWLDPFCGSGTTIGAAHNEGRRGLGIEKLEKYVAVILQRLSDMGLQPVKV